MYCNRHHPLALLTASLALAACDVPSRTIAPADLRPLGAAVTDNEVVREPLSFSSPSGCTGTGEVIEYSGWILWRSQYSRTSSGVVQEHWGTTIQGMSGVGLTTGTVYRRVAADQGSWVITRTAADKYTAVVHGRIIGQGSVPDFYFRLTTQLTQNANGEWTADVESVESSCDA